MVPSRGTPISTHRMHELLIVLKKPCLALFEPQHRHLKGWFKLHDSPPNPDPPLPSDSGRIKSHRSGAGQIFFESDFQDHHPTIGQGRIE